MTKSGANESKVGNSAKTFSKLQSGLEFAQASRSIDIAAFAQRFGAAQIELKEVHTAAAAQIQMCDLGTAFASRGTDIKQGLLIVTNRLSKIEECLAEGGDTLKGVVSCFRGV